MSNELKEFYRAYKAWLDAGAPDGKPFTRSCGLCTNLFEFCLGLDIDECDVSNEMCNQFATARLPESYPFGIDNYHTDRLNETQHLNLARIKWVEEHAA